MKNYYDEFSRLPIEKMAQKITDMTFSFQETQVPKKHYKELLSKTVEEVIAGSVEVNLIDTYYKTLEQLMKQNPKWLFQAMLCFDTKIKPSTMSSAEYQALELTWAKFQENKKSKTVDKQWLDYFESIKKNGAMYEFRKDMD
ncbi:hypothetical protein ABE871_17200 [Enterococcus gilvus]|uniref:hypothetical protein n=1 Tax=Enterococcus gilvus TaxID=160453 RepID=UPI003D6B6888